MRKFVIDILKFIPFAAVIYVLLIIFVGEFAPGLFRKNMNYKIGSYGSTLSRFNEIDGYLNEEVDIVFLGSSHSYRAFDGRVFEEQGMCTFNMGSSAQTFIQTEVLIDAYLPDLKPKLVVIEVNPVTFSSDGVESSLDIIANVGVSWKVTKMTMRQNHLKVYNSLIFGYYHQLVHGLSDNINYETVKGDTYIKGGYVEKESQEYAPGKIKNKEYEMNELQVESFEFILEELSNKGIEVLLVQSPVTEKFYNSIENSDEFDDKMEATKVPYINFNEIDLGLNDDLHFYDHHHMNQTGVEIYNEKFIEVLTKEYEFKLGE